MALAVHLGVRRHRKQRQHDSRNREDSHRLGLLDIPVSQDSRFAAGSAIVDGSNL
jgi:hypothetical protein